MCKNECCRKLNASPPFLGLKKKRGGQISFTLVFSDPEPQGLAEVLCLHENPHIQPRGVWNI